MPPSVAIVIPSLNQGAFLEDAIKSLMGQAGVDLQVALTDGGSTDQTRGIMSLYKDKFDYFRSFPDNGQGAAVNEGVSHLKSAAYVGWLNADDVMLPDGLWAMSSFLDHHPEYIAVFGKALIIDEKGRITGEYPTKPFNKRAFAVYCTICQPASLIRRSAWDEVGGLDESIQTCMDYDLWWRLSKIGQIGYIEQCVAHARDHSQTKTRTLRKKVNEEAISILLRHWGMVPKNWCMANILEGLEENGDQSRFFRKCRAYKAYVQINGWKALLPQNWLLTDPK
jgi:hypothetical protein